MSLSPSEIRAIARALARELRLANDNHSGPPSPAGIAAPVVDDDPYFIPPTAVVRGAYIYFARCHSPDRQIKIGYARDVGHRFSVLRNGCPYRVTCLAFYWVEHHIAEEKRLHDMFAQHRQSGEWFAPANELVELVASLQEMRRNAVTDALRSEVLP